MDEYLKRYQAARDAGEAIVMDVLCPGCGRGVGATDGTEPRGSTDGRNITKCECEERPSLTAAEIGVGAFGEYWQYFNHKAEQPPKGVWVD